MRLQHTAHVCRAASFAVQAHMSCALTVLLLMEHGNMLQRLTQLLLHLQITAIINFRKSTDWLKMQ